MANPLKGLGGFGAILFLLGAGLSVAATFIANIPMAPVILGVLGLVVGFVNVASKESLSFLVATIAVSMLSGVLASLPAIGGFVESALVNLAIFAGAASLVVALRVIFKVASK